ncbi:type I pantothenate kinase, partial [Enterococcus faecalis]
MEKLINFLNEVKRGKDEIKAPVNTHSVYDVIEGEYELIQQPEILIVEGINTLQLPANQQLYVSDFYDFSIFVDADP